MEETGFDREVLDAVQAETPDLETLLRQRRDYQSAFDKKVSSALQTARANWEREQAEALEQARTQELERARSAAPAEPVPTPAFDRESLRGMSPGEIYAHWAEIQNTLKG